MSDRPPTTADADAGGAAFSRSSSTAAVRLPPFSVEAERAVLGAIFLSPAEAMPVAVDALAADDFYREAHRLVFGACLELHHRRVGPDPLAVYDLLKGRGLDQQAGGLVYLTDAMEQTPSAANVEHYCTIVREKADLRRLIAACADISAGAYRGGVGADHTAFLDDAERRVLEATTRAVGRAKMRTAAELAGPALRVLGEYAAHPAEVRGLASGFQSLDALTCGFEPGQLLVLAARPGVGKTTLALNLAVRAAAATMRPVLFFSLEMTTHELFVRQLASEAGVDHMALQRGRAGQESIDATSDAAGRLSGLPIHYAESARLTTFDVRAQSRRIAHGTGVAPALVVVDYLLLLSPAHRSDTREREVAEITRALKSIAVEVNTPLLALSQLSRKTMMRERARPELDDLRDSGAIEQDADVVLFLWPSKKGEVVNGAVAKNRRGPTGDFKLTWRKNSFRFEEHDGGDEEGPAPTTMFGYGRPT